MDLLWRSLSHATYCNQQIFFAHSLSILYLAWWNLWPSLLPEIRFNTSLHRTASSLLTGRNRINISCVSTLSPLYRVSIQCHNTSTHLNSEEIVPALLLADRSRDSSRSTLNLQQLPSLLHAQLFSNSGNLKTFSVSILAIYNVFCCFLLHLFLVFVH